MNETLLGSRTILAGQDLLLSCGSINPSEVTSLMWRKEDGSPFPGDAVTAINGSLFIPTVEVGDRGVYQCHLDTGTAQTTLKYNITVAGGYVCKTELTLNRLQSERKNLHIHTHIHADRQTDE